MNIDWFIVTVIVAVILLIIFVYRYHTKGTTEITPSSFVTEALSGLEAPKSVDPEDDPLGQLAPMLATFEFTYPERDNFIKIKAEHGDSKPTEKALFERALACVAKITHVQRCFPTIQQAKQSNILPDDVWNMTQMKMKEIDDEYQDIRKEADSMVANGGATIFQEAARLFQQIQHQMAAQHQQRMAQAQAQPQAQAKAAAPEAIQGTPTQATPTPTPAQLAHGPIPIPAQLPQQPKIDMDKQTELKKKLEQPQAEKKHAEQVKKPADDAQTLAQKKAAADKAYKELLREEAQGGKKSKKSKKDE